MIRVAILGASGFVGAELLRLCDGHPELEPVGLFGDSQAGAALDSVHPHLALAYPGRTLERYAPEALAAITALSFWITAGVPVAMILPALSTVISSATDITRRMLCSTIRMV